MNWTTEKPNIKEPCVLVTAYKHKRAWDYEVFQFDWFEGIDGMYLALLTGDGIEWGVYSELKAHKYLILPKH